MIVSSCEVQNVLSLVRAGPLAPLNAMAERTFGSTFPDHTPERTYAGSTPAVLPGQDRLWRDTRVLELRSRLVAGRYAVTPDVIADKIIGRALCDQVSRLYDR